MGKYREEKLENLCVKITDGSHAPPEGIADSKYLMLSSKNIYNNSINYDDPRYLSENDYCSENKRTEINSGDVLLTIVGTIGRVAVVPEVFKPFTLQRSVAVIKPDSRKLFSRYLMYFLQDNVSHLVSESRGVAQKGIYLGQVSKLPIPLPPLEEQKRIAAILDAADAIRAKRAAAIAKLDELAQSVFLEMFGDPVRNEKGWEISSISKAIDDGSILLHKDGNHGSNYPRESDFSDEGIPFLSAKYISDDGSIIQDNIPFLRNEKAKKLTIGWIEKDDVLLAHNATVGKVGIYDGQYDKCLIGTSLTAFRLNTSTIAPLFFFNLLRSPYFQNQLFSVMGQTTRNQVPITAQRELEIIIPDKSVQEKFLDTFRKIQVLENSNRQALAREEALFASLQHRAFAGEL